MVAKLHELLAAESSLAAAYNAIGEETLKVMGKPDLMTRMVTKVTHFDEAESKLDAVETKEEVTTVEDRLSYQLGRGFINYIDLLVQKDRTNQEARADVIVNGVAILLDIPATALLTLESKLGELRKKFEAAPTLQSGPVWGTDPDRPGMRRSMEPAVSFKTRKTMKPVVLHPATKEHPAQVEKVVEDVPIARIERITWSGMWSPKDKHDALARLDALLVAVKKARQRANRTEVVRVYAGQAIANFLLKGPPGDDLTGSDEEGC